MPDDTELLAQIGRGDQAAFRTLLDRHARYLFGVAHAMSGSEADAEDIVQETLIGALNSSGRFRGESSVRTWLVRILVNRVRMWRRSGNDTKEPFTSTPHRRVNPLQRVVPKPRPTQNSTSRRCSRN